MNSSQSRPFARAKLYLMDDRDVLTATEVNEGSSGVQRCQLVKNKRRFRAGIARYSDWLRAGRPWSRSSSPGEGKNFHFSVSSRPVLRSTQPPIQWVTRGNFPGSKVAGE
jgi:hypothetical protein